MLVNCHNSIWLQYIVEIYKLHNQSLHMVCLVSELSNHNMSECPREIVQRRGGS